MSTHEAQAIQDLQDNSSLDNLSEVNITYFVSEGWEKDFFIITLPASAKGHIPTFEDLNWAVYSLEFTVDLSREIDNFAQIQQLVSQLRPAIIQTINYSLATYPQLAIKQRKNGNSIIIHLDDIATINLNYTITRQELREQVEARFNNTANEQVDSQNWLKNVHLTLTAFDQTVDLDWLDDIDLP